MSVSIDLHVHTTHSGTGSVTVAQLVGEARKRNLRHVVVTDSDTIEAGFTTANRHCTACPSVLLDSRP